MSDDRATARAFVERLFAAHHSEIYAYLCRMVRDDELAADLTQEAFVKAYRAYETLEDQNRARAWLYQIAGRTALDELRRRKRSAELAVEPAGDEPVPEGEAEAAERRATVHVALASLEPRERELIALKFHAGLSNAEIADVLGVSASNAGTRVHRALARLREACHAPS